MEGTGRGALGELDRMLGMLRQAAPGDEPGLASLRELVQRMGRADIQVTVDSDVAEARLPRSMSMCAYRIIQEALITASSTGTPMRRGSRCATHPRRSGWRSATTGGACRRGTTPAEGCSASASGWRCSAAA
jgi:hypothetical protein